MADLSEPVQKVEMAEFIFTSTRLSFLCFSSGELLAPLAHDKAVCFKKYLKFWGRYKVVSASFWIS